MASTPRFSKLGAKLGSLLLGVWLSSCGSNSAQTTVAPTDAGVAATAVQLQATSEPVSTPIYFSGFEDFVSNGFGQGFTTSEYTGQFGAENFTTNPWFVPFVPLRYGSTDAAWMIVDNDRGVRPPSGSGSMYKGWIRSNLNWTENNGAFPILHTTGEPDDMPDLFGDYPDGLPMPLVNRFYAYADWRGDDASKWMHFASWSETGGVGEGWQPVTLSTKGNGRMEMGHINQEALVNLNNYKFPKNEWVRFTVYMDFSKPQGEFIVWMDGTAILRGEGRRAGFDAGNHLRRAHWGMYTHPTFPVGAVQYKDDIQLWSLSEPWTDLSQEPPSPYDGAGL